MHHHFPDVEISRRLSELRNDLRQIEKRIETMLGSISAAENELVQRSDRSPTSPDDSLAARIADGVVSRLAISRTDIAKARKEYLREKEVAQYMGVSVFSLRSWRSKGSKNGPPFVHIGRMVLYPVVELEKHMLRFRSMQMQ